MLGKLLARIIKRLLGTIKEDLPEETARLRQNKCPHCAAPLRRALIFVNRQRGWCNSFCCPDLHFAVFYVLNKTTAGLKYTFIDELGPPVKGLGQRIKWL